MRIPEYADAQCTDVVGASVGASGEEAGMQPADSEKEVSTEPTMVKKGEMRDETQIRGHKK